MAKKIDSSNNMVERFAEFKELKNIDKTTMISVLEESFRSVLAKMFGTDQNLDVIMNPDKGDVQIFQNLEVVEDGSVVNPNLEISLSDARADGDPDVEIGEEHTKEIFFEKFGRRAIQNLRQTLQTKILDLQKEALMSKFKALEHEIVSGEVYQTWSRETLLLDDEKNEMILPRSEAIPGDYFRKGEIVRAVVLRVEERGNNPVVTLSRTNELFLRRLFEQEVPEIQDGLINIKRVARIPGERAKIAVESYDDRIDPVGACVGVKGSRIHGIVRELRNENIDVVSYSDNPQVFITRALSPAHVNRIMLDEERRQAEVYLNQDEVSLAIGKGGMNIKLASMLTGYQIEVFSDAKGGFDPNDLYLDEFVDEIDGVAIDAWIIEALKNIGLMTAKDVLRTPRQELIDRADLEEGTVDHVLEVLSAEFDDDELAELRGETIPAAEEAAEEAEAEQPEEPAN